MKYILLYVIVLLALFANEALSKPRKKSPKASSSAAGFCKNKTIGHGRQIKGGFCSTTIQGDIPNVNKMTSSFIIFPENEAVLGPNKAFNVKVAIENLQTGFFSDPEKEYYSDPQTLNDNGLIKGHSHVTIQEINGSSPPDAKKFAFFEGLNEKAEDGILVAKVVDENGKPGLPSGKYRICTMSSSFTHQPLVMPVAKRGAQDDCIRITVGVDGDKVKAKDEAKDEDKGKAKDGDKGKAKDGDKGKAKDGDKGKAKDGDKGKAKDEDKD